VGGTRTAVAALLVLVLALVVVAAVAVPWRSSAPNPTGSAVAVDPDRDFSSAEREREDAFHREARPPRYLGMAVSLSVLLVLALTPLGSRLVAWSWPGQSGPWVLRLLVGTIVITAIVRLATLPTAVWSRSVSRRYGLSTQTTSGWALDVLRGWLLMTLLTFAALAVLVLLARRWPETWWAPAALLAALAVVAGSFLYPVVIEPVFNRFTSLPQSELRTDLLELAERDGLRVDDVLVADASRRTTSLNAYVSGFGATRRIVLYDTLLEQASDAEIRTVVAHELAHAKRNDVLVGTALGALGAAAAVVVLFLVLGDPGFRRRADVLGAADVRSIALVLATVSVLTLVTTPLQSLISRRVEARADVHALGLTRDPQAAVDLQRRLAVRNLSDLDPSPVVYGLFATHPTAPERIAIARRWALANGVPEPREGAPR
jgi:STE24 endopeptidase